MAVKVPDDCFVFQKRKLLFLFQFGIGSNTATERQEELLAQRAAATGKSVDELRAAALAKSGIRRIGQVEDIAALALFLCSERARHIQGTATAVDGGAGVGYY